MIASVYMDGRKANSFQLSVADLHTAIDLGELQIQLAKLQELCKRLALVIEADNVALILWRTGMAEIGLQYLLGNIRGIT